MSKVNHIERGNSDGHNKGLNHVLFSDRLGCHRFADKYFRLQLDWAGLNLLVCPRLVIADPQAVGARGKQEQDEVAVKAPSVPNESLMGPERRCYHNRHVRVDVQEEGHIDI